MLEIHSLIKAYGSKVAVDNVSFKVKKGEIFALIGPNSSGKTTIVKTVVGLQLPSSGSVVVDGHDVVRESKEAKEFIGYIPDEPSVWPKMTGGEFLQFVRSLYKGSHKSHADINVLVDNFALNGLEDTEFESYSRGARQKFSIISALSHNPKLLVIDEPIVGLDPAGASYAKSLFVGYARDGGAVLLVTHTLSVAEEIADRIGVLKHGKLIAVGTLNELREASGLKEHATLEEIYTVLTK